MKQEEKTICESESKLCMRFDMNTIQHLGVKLYSKLPPVLAELVANAYDADASEVIINLNDSDEDNKSIIIKDDGNGMTFEEINNKFLMIGRNKRVSGDAKTAKERQVIGKKGIGKLSIFGIVDYITLTTIKDKKKNQFKLSLPDILKSKNEYHPEHITINEETKEANGTTLILSNFKRKSGFNPIEIAKDLAKRFLIFDDKFKVTLIYNGNTKTPVKVTSDLRFADITPEFEWTFPNATIDTTYPNYNEVKGKIITAITPVPPNMKGIYLVARGKLVHSNDFYGISANDYAHAYLTGYLNVDFIDTDEEDLISTNRESLNWENEETERLQKYLQKIISFITQDWREKRKKKKEEQIKNKTGVDLPAWIDSLPAQERPLAKKITDLIIKNETMEIARTAELVEYIKDSYEFGSFKEFAAQLGELTDITGSDLLKLFKDWGLIEAKEMYKLAMIRIKAIEQFEKKIKENAREVPEMHEFLKNFPWLLDPRIMNFDDEVTYSSLLKERFKEGSDIPDEDKRIDFLCIDLASTIFIIELKRPHTKANDKFLDQALEYSSFLKEKKGSDPEFSKRTIKTFLICDGVINVPKTREKADAYAQSDKVYIRTYIELLQHAKRYHKEFIEKYNRLNKKPSS